MSTELQTETKRVVLLEDEVLHRRLPINFQPEDLKLFEHELEKPIPATELVQLENVRISSDGILFRGLKLLPESFAFPFLEEQWRTRSRVKFFVTNQLLRKRRSFERESLWITDDWSYGYFHWLSDALAKLYVVRERLTDSVLLLPGHYRSLPFVTASLAAFTVPEVAYIERDEVVVVNQLTLPTPVAPSGHFRENVVRGVRNQLLRKYGSPEANRAGRRLYISRGRAPKRRVSNEVEVIELLREFQFEVVRAEDLTFAEQVETASRAELLVSNHGAGLTNMMFMPTRSTVLELRHANDCINNCYYTLADALGLNYFYQKCEATNAAEDAHTADLLVDIAELRRNLTDVTVVSKESERDT